MAAISAEEPLIGVAWPLSVFGVYLYSFYGNYIYAQNYRIISMIERIYARIFLCQKEYWCFSFCYGNITVLGWISLKGLFQEGNEWLMD